MEVPFGNISTKSLEPSELALTCFGLCCVNWDCSDTDFEFVAGDCKVCRVHSVFAEFLSPKVARLRRCDVSCTHYTFENSELFDVFQSFVANLLSGQSFRVEHSNFPALLRLAQELENSGLLSSLLGMINTESFSLHEAILLLQGGIVFSDEVENLKDFIASHFYEIKKEILDDLSLETSQLLLSSPSLKIEDEDSLYDFVRSRCEKDLRFTSLFEFIYFEYLSIDRVENFVSFENLLENLNSNIWERVCARLILGTELKNNPRVFSTEPPKEEPAPDPRKEFVYDESRQLDGVIAYLTRQCGGNVHHHEIVNVTASSVYGNNASYNQSNVVDFGGGGFYHSKNEPNPRVCYDFKERRITPTSYSVRSSSNAPGGAHLKSWVIEVSNDGESWREIDRRDNNGDLNAPYVTRNFRISHVPNESFRFFRLRQTGPSHYANGTCNYVSFSALEIFGTLWEK